MRRIILFLALTCPAFGQTPFVRIPPDDAAKHLISKPSPAYPALAKATHITGPVILEISINESGKPSVRRAVSGHPLLIFSATDSISGWVYQPFELNGKPATVKTFVMVAFEDTASQDTQGHAEMLLLHNFWTAEDAALTALATGDYAGASQQLSQASDILGPASHHSPQLLERSQWMTTMGQLYMDQKKFEESEPYYKNALKLLQDNDKEAPETAAALAHLGYLYAQEKKYDLARELANKSVGIYNKNFKRAGSGNPSLQQTCGTAIVYQSWMLSRVAVQQNDQKEAGKDCRAVLEFQTFLNSSDRDTFVSACQQTLLVPGSKN